VCVVALNRPCPPPLPAASVGSAGGLGPVMGGSPSVGPEDPVAVEPRGRIALATQNLCNLRIGCVNRLRDSVRWCR